MLHGIFMGASRERGKSFAGPCWARQTPGTTSITTAPNMSHPPRPTAATMSPLYVTTLRCLHPYVCETPSSRTMRKAHSNTSQFRFESCHVSAPRLVLIFTPLALTAIYLHGGLHGIFTELHGLRGFCPYPFFTPYPFLPLGKKGALMSHGWAWWPRELTRPFKLRFGPRPRLGER